MIPGERRGRPLPQPRPEMPKYCSAPNCRNYSGSGSKSFYKFPLQDPLRLQQWVSNMGRGNWTPSRLHYICHEHFEPSCFNERWGIRYLECDAVPTVFQEHKKRKATDHSEGKPKCLRGNDHPGVAVSDDRTETLDAAKMTSASHTVQLYEIAVEPAQQGETSLVEWSNDEESDHPQTDMDSLVSVGLNFPLTLYQMVENPDNELEDTDLLLMSADDGQNELVKEFTAAVLSQGGRLVMNEPMLGCTDEAVAPSGVQHVTYGTEELPDIQEGHETEVIAYFETIPNVFPSETSAQFTSSPDTVLSSALSSEPISSTLPITSKHVAPSTTPLVLTLQSLDTEVTEGDEGMSETDDLEQQDQQLEEHCYHKNNLNKDQLEVMVAELQKKVKVLQQRHRRHLEKLLGLENMVSQLRQSNLLNEERLQLLERAYLQGGAAASDAGETVAIIYEEDNAAYLYTPLKDAETML
ncbi:THAP domain-containing protein 5-like [Xenentodon cancila]